MSSDIRFRTNTAKLTEVILHLNRADADFVPRLSLRVDIPQYAKKIIENALVCEAWAGAELVGMVAGYCNDPRKNAVFVTNVSILSEWRRHGVANQLFLELALRAGADGFKELVLEVARSNTPAVSLYRKMGFTPGSGESDSITMRMPLPIGQGERR